MECPALRVRNSARSICRRPSAGRRAAGAGERAHCVVVCDPDVAGAAREVCERIPRSGSPTRTIPLTHHGHNRTSSSERVAKNRLHVELFTYFLKKLKTTPDGDGTLLDYSAVLYGSALSD